MKKIGILGCTGSIGKSALRVIEADEDLKPTLLANESDLTGLKKLIEKYNPDTAICVGHSYLYHNGKEFNFSDNPLNFEETYADTDIVVNGIGGIAGLLPTLAVIRAGKILATANKESFVSAGSIINSEKVKNNGVIYPLDSEHSAIWQLLQGQKTIKKVVLTASGGAFRDYSSERLKSATSIDALKHPTWLMGKKVTVDCATLMNKGMEIIEAKHFFGLPVDVIGHRESIVHAFVQFEDGTFHANMSYPDMVVPISYALHYSQNQNNKKLDSNKFIPKQIDLSELSSLNFFKLDEVRFPCLSLAKQVSEMGDRAGCVLNAADEVLVNRYLKGEIGFYDISTGISKALDKFAENGDFEDINSVFRMDKAVREYTLSIDFGGLR